jgi:N-dimethylarginine dimethylaminohydrolase
MLARGRRDRRKLVPRLAAWCTLLCVVAAAVSSEPRAHRTRTAPASVLADDGGPLQEIALHYDPDLELLLQPTYRDLFAALGPHTRLQVICPTESGVAEFERNWGRQARYRGRECTVLSVKRPLTIWSRDRRIARQDPATGRPVSTFVPRCHSADEPDKRSELAIPRILARRGLLAEPYCSPISVEGGNVVGNSRHVFIGANLLEENPARRAAPERLIDRLQTLFGRPVVILAAGDGAPPWCHVDMYLTPVGPNMVLLACPRLATRILDANDACDAVDTDRVPLLDDEAEIDEVAERLDDVQAQLRRLGYDVRRLPAIPNVDEDYLLTYNNVLMETVNGRRHVYLPQYRVPLLDAAAQETYRRLGFTVHPVDVSQIYKFGGAVRCMANVTVRGRLTPTSQPARRTGSPPLDQRKPRRTGRRVDKRHDLHAEQLGEARLFILGDRRAHHVAQHGAKDDVGEIVHA